MVRGSKKIVEVICTCPLPFSKPNVARVRVTVSLVNAEAIRECSTAGERHAGLLIVANLRNEILFRAKVRDAALLSSAGNRLGLTRIFSELSIHFA